MRFLPWLPQIFRTCTCVALFISCVGAAHAENVTISVRDTEIAEVIEMISRQQRVNVLLPGKVSGEISLNLYDVPVERALAAVANAGGFALEKRGDSYFLINHDEVGRYARGSVTELRWYELNYVDGAKVKDMVESYLSRYGKISFVENRNLIVVEDSPEFLRRVDALIRAVDQQPRQVMIEARILEVTLNDDEKFGIDWQDLFQSRNLEGGGDYGTRGFTPGPDAAGFFFNLETPNVTAALNALRDEGRLRTLSTPKLVALEKQEASVVIGDRRGYQVTTTINQVTTESIEFLESGVILRVNVEIDDQDRILMSVHPEVSTGAVDANGIPSQTTTEVTTNLLIPSGETVFIGGLIKKSETEQRQSVPFVNRVPVVRRLFSGTENTQITTETVVLIRPTLADDINAEWNTQEIRRVEGENIEAPKYRKWRPLTEREREKAVEQPRGHGPARDADPLESMQKPELIAFEAPEEPTPGTSPSRPVPDIWPLIEVGEAVVIDEPAQDSKPLQAAANPAPSIAELSDLGPVAVAGIAEPVASMPAPISAVTQATAPKRVEVEKSTVPKPQTQPAKPVVQKKPVQTESQVVAPVAIATTRTSGVRWLN